MGWWSLGGRRGDDLAQRVGLELSGRVVRSEVRRGGMESTVHLLVQPPGANRPRWVVALVRAADDMVKLMGEDSGPYCEPCSPGFYAEAVKLCEPPNPQSFASDFRARMAAA